MKLFALITASLMAAAGGAYYLSSGSPCCSTRAHTDCPVAEVGGCCDPGASAKPVCCVNPCPACSSDCLTCCDACEFCCSEGVQASVKAIDKPACCAGKAQITATPKPDCCVTGADCCISACCFGVTQSVAKPTADEGCCMISTSPAQVATSAVMAGIATK